MDQLYTGLQESPFRAPRDSRFFYQSPMHEEALARLHFLVDQRRRLGLLLGGHGVGKSLVLEVFAHALSRAGHAVASVGLLGVDVREMLWEIAAGLGTNPGAEDDTFHLWRRLTDRLAENRIQHRTTVILFDDADEASDAVRLNIERLAQLCPLSGTRLTLVLAANDQPAERLGQRLLDLAALRIDLGAWDEADTAGYLQSALAEVGRDAQAFAPGAVARLHKLARGVPSQVNHLADLALLAGAGEHLQQIDTATVDSVHGELSARRAAG